MVTFSHFRTQRGGKRKLFNGSFSIPFPFYMISSRNWLTYMLSTLKVSKSQKQNCRKKLLPKMNERICFSILTVRNYLKLEISISSFKYIRTVRIEKQIRSFIFGRSFFQQFCFWDLLTFRQKSSLCCYAQTVQEPIQGSI